MANWEKNDEIRKWPNGNNHSNNWFHYKASQDASTSE